MAQEDGAFTRKVGKCTASTKWSHCKKVGSRRKGNSWPCKGFDEVADHGHSSVILTVLLDQAVEAPASLLQILYWVVFVTVSADVFDNVALRQ